MKSLKLSFIYLFFLITTFGCIDSKKEGNEDNTNIEGTVMKNENNLLLHHTLKPGMTFLQIDSLFPHKDLELESEIFGDNYQEATMEYKILDRNGYININFHDSVMYSFYYELDSIEGYEADSIYSKLKKIYTKEFPDLTEEVVEEGNQNILSTYWKQPDFEYVITYNLNSRSLSWGLQERK